jgi:uncharacterized membrane protein YozB (DUF420 family)
MLVRMVLAPESSSDRTQIGGSGRDAHAERVARQGSRRRGNRIALIGLAVVVTAFVAIFIPKYLTFNANLGRLSPVQYPYYFPVMMVHVLTATVTITTCVLQVWPWLLRRHPRVHRWVGRMYVICVYPASLAAITISLLWAFSPVSGLSDIVHALAWMAATTAGYVYIRKGQFFYHRRWMLRSFMLTVSNILNRVVGLPIQAILAARLTTMFGGNEKAMMQAVAACDSWLCWTVSLIWLEWWMDRDFRRFGPGRRAVTAANEQLGRLRRLDDATAQVPARATASVTTAPATAE